jgi:two-component sensor histidine kinase
MRPLRGRPGFWLIAGLAVFAIAFVIRYSADMVLEAVPFITFFPAIVIAAVIGGNRAAFIVAFLGFVTGWYFFLPPAQSWDLSAKSVWSLAFYWVTASVMLYVTFALDKAVENLAAERDRAATLFRELQHRVANNLAFVGSLLRLGRREIVARPKEALAILDQAQARLDIMSRIHRRLYDPAIVDQPLQVYLTSLSDDILQAGGAKHLVCSVCADPELKLDLSQLVTLSLLLNELLTNAVKHAFKERDEGAITLGLAREGRDVVLSVHDNGSGFSALTNRARGYGQ